LFGPFHVEGPGRGKPPQPFDDKVSLPGKIPPTVKSLSGSWHFGYMLREVSANIARERVDDHRGD
jgi:hypothetical protein